MPRNLNPIALASASGTNVYYTELYNIMLPNSPDLHLTPNLPTLPAGIAWQVGDISYQGAGMARNAIRTNSDNVPETLTVGFQNVDTFMGFLAENLELRGAVVTISGAYIDPDTLTVTPDSIFPVASRKIGQITVNNNTVNVNADSPLADITTKIPRRRYGKQDGFPWRIRV